MHVSVDVCDEPRAILAGATLQARPDGEAVDDKLTVPVKPFTGATVIVEVAVDPAFAEVLVGLAVTLKSWLVMVTVAVWVIPPLVPVTVTV